MDQETANAQLFKALRNYDVALFEDALANNADVNARDGGFTTLQVLLGAEKYLRDSLLLAAVMDEMDGDYNGIAQEYILGEFAPKGDGALGVPAVRRSVDLDNLRHFLRRHPWADNPVDHEDYPSDETYDAACEEYWQTLFDAAANDEKAELVIPALTRLRNGKCKEITEIFGIGKTITSLQDLTSEDVFQADVHENDRTCMHATDIQKMLGVLLEKISKETLNAPLPLTGETVLHMAVYHHVLYQGNGICDDLESLLRSHGAIEVPDKNGVTPSILKRNIDPDTTLEGGTYNPVDDKPPQQGRGST